MPKITVLLAMQDDAAAVELTARSVLAQTLPDLELLLLDPASAASSDLAGLDDRIALVPTAGAALGEALNHGAALAQGDVIARVSAGDVLAPERLERQAGLLAAAPDLAFVATGWQECRPDGSVRRVVRPPVGDPALRAAMATADVIGHPTAMMRREAVAAAGFWRPAFAGSEDYDLLLRMLDRHTGTCVPQPLVAFTTGEELVGWRALEQQILSELGAVAAHDRRQIGRPDHGEQKSPLDRGLLHRMGMAEDEIAKTVIARAMKAAMAAGEAGEWRAMREAARLGLHQAGLPKRIKARLFGLWFRSVARRRPAPVPGLTSGFGKGHAAL